MCTTAASVDTRVRVERFENINATVLPSMGPWRLEASPDLMAFLALAALRTSEESSSLERSPIERKCLGGVDFVMGAGAAAAAADMLRRRCSEVVEDRKTRFRFEVDLSREVEDTREEERAERRGGNIVTL